MNYEQLCRRFRKAKPQDETPGRYTNYIAAFAPPIMRILLKERVVYMSSTTKINVPDIFASMVFNDDVMRERLPKDVYKSLRKTIDNGKDLDITVD